MGRVRGPRGTTQRCVGRLLVYVVPHLPRREGVLVRRQSSTQGATRPRGPSHAALVFDGDVAVGWCQFGSPDELKNIKHRKEYEAELDSLPDYRLTCFFVDTRYRRRGVSALALQGALDLIAKAGGGVVEAYTQDTGGKKISASSSTASPAACSNKPVSATCGPRARTTPSCGRRSTRPGIGTR